MCCLGFIFVKNYSVPMRFLILSLFCFSSLSSLSQQKDGLTLTPDEFQKSISAGNPLILDVRTANEFRSGHLQNAMQANWNDTAEFRARTRHIDREQPVYIYCLGGSRSVAAAAWMRSQGFSRVIELDGGISAWKMAGKPLENAAPVKQISLSEFAAKINPNKTVLVDVGADWCPPCRKMKPVVNALIHSSAGKVDLLIIDAGEQTELLKALNVTSYPTFIIYKKGKEVWRGEGIFSSEELKKWLY